VTEIALENDVKLSWLDASLGLDASQKRVGLYAVRASNSCPGKLALIVLWKDVSSSRNWMPEKVLISQMLRHRCVRIVRDYGMFDRREAPQLFSDAEGRETMHAELVR
jgi:hypothetical protein